MIEIARLPADDRRELFHNTAAKTGLHDAIVEKDFWVCLTLDYLFHHSPWKKAVTFKGGTSLSKGYHLISRFSDGNQVCGDSFMSQKLKGEGRIIRSEEHTSELQSQR